jgi:hypothetical protein
LHLSGGGCLKGGFFFVTGHGCWLGLHPAGVA